MLTGATVQALAQSGTPPPTARTGVASATPVSFRAAKQPADAREPIRIQYQAPAACPSASSFLDDVLARTPRARAAAAGELARVFQVNVVSRRGESFGEISVTRPSDSMPVRLSAVGKCENVLKTLAQFAAISIDPSALLASAQELELPENPYRNWDGPIAPPLPENPYRNWSGALLPALPENPYRNSSAAVSPDLPGNPYRNPRTAAPELPNNPYRTESAAAGN